MEERMVPLDELRELAMGMYRRACELSIRIDPDGARVLFGTVVAVMIRLAEEIGRTSMTQEVRGQVLEFWVNFGWVEEKSGRLPGLRFLVKPEELGQGAAAGKFEQRVDPVVVPRVSRILIPSQCLPVPCSDKRRGGWRPHWHEGTPPRRCEEPGYAGGRDNAE